MMLRKVLFLSIFLILPLSSFQLKAEEKSSDCLACHQKDTRGIFQTWVNSKHFKHGVDCVTCHKSHQEAKPKKSAVEPEVCGKCHAKQFEQFQQGRHSITWDRMKEHRQYQTLPDSLKKALCERCHNIQNKCNSCHTSHAFNAEEAREPESCKKCHTGMAGPHDEMYASSIHGTIYAAEQNSKRTATCVTCHMHKGTHDSSFGVIYDSLGNAVDKNGRPLSKQEQEKIRQPLIKEVCHQCHIPDLTMERLELADQVKNEAKKVLAEAEKTIRELEEEGILPRGITLGQNQLYSGTSRIEGLYYRMFQFHNVYAWKGAYHFSPDFAHWYGWAHLQLSLIEIKEEARKLRELAKLKK
jgi:Seven times multi-haem cytochrome CxxCH